MNIYFTASITGGRQDQPIYNRIIELLGSYGRVLTEHVGNEALTVAGESHDPKHIHDRDLAWLAQADVMVAETTMPSLGVGYEIAYAEHLGKKILCIYRKVPGRKLSSMIGGSNKLRVVEYQTVEDLKPIFNSFFKT